MDLFDIDNEDVSVWELPSWDLPGRQGLNDHREHRRARNPRLLI